MNLILLEIDCHEAMSETHEIWVAGIFSSKQEAETAFALFEKKNEDDGLIYWAKFKPFTMNILQEEYP